MRRRLILVTSAVTGMVVLAFLVPLFILIGDLVSDTAIHDAEQQAEGLAENLSALVLSYSPEDAVETLNEEPPLIELNASVVLSDGTVVGFPIPDDEDLSAAAAGSSYASRVPGGVAVYVPILVSDGTNMIVRMMVPEEELTEGVLYSRIILSFVGIVLVLIGGWIADRLGRTLVQPVKELSVTANRLGAGDLTARVVPSGPEEIEDLGIEFNRLAGQIDRLLEKERESTADLAHRLRTPLTAARLTVDGLEEGPVKERLNVDMDELERTTNFVIREARRPVRRETEEWCDFAEIVRERTDFWHPLAAEQGRDVGVEITDEPTPIAVPTGDVEAAIDALLENVLSHTEDGVPFNVSVTVDELDIILYIEDAGAGFVDQMSITRGVSLADSTGLGLDIVRRTVEEAGGALSIGESTTLGGAGIVITFPRLEEAKGQAS